MTRKCSQQEVEEYYKQFGYEILEEYKNNRTPLKMKCPLGHITKSMTYWSFKKGNRCPECSRRLKLTYEYVKNQFENEGYKMISKEYINANIKLEVRCPKGHNWKTTYGHFYDGKRCPHCKTSKGENKVKEVLEKLNIQFIQQYKFDDCKINYTLYDQNNKETKFTTKELLEKTINDIKEANTELTIKYQVSYTNEDDRTVTKIISKKIILK